MPPSRINHSSNVLPVQEPQPLVPVFPLLTSLAAFVARVTTNCRGVAIGFAPPIAAASIGAAATTITFAGTAIGMHKVDARTKSYPQRVCTAMILCLFWRARGQAPGPRAETALHMHMHALRYHFCLPVAAEVARLPTLKAGYRGAHAAAANTAATCTILESCAAKASARLLVWAVPAPVPAVCTRVNVHVCVFKVISLSSHPVCFGTLAFILANTTNKHLSSTLPKLHAL